MYVMDSSVNIWTRGGKLLIYETVTPDAILPGYIFGLLPGWWLGMFSK